MTTIDRLKELERDAELACEAAFEKREELGGAVNWADLHCVEAGHCRTSDGGEYLYVSIEEADPSQSELYRFVYQFLADKGWQQVNVRFEW